MAEKVDTSPEQEQPVDENFTIDDIILGNESEEALSALDTKPPAEEEKPKNNDDTRYEYWQSQADKRDNENKELRAQLAQMNAKLTETMEKISTPPPVVEKPSEADSEGKFPPPPEKPTPPTGYSEEAAMNDPNSPSAAYVREAQAWYDNMIKYNELKAEYANRRIDDFLAQQKQREAAAAAEQERRKKVAKQLAGVADLVQKEYGATREQAIEFVKTMSSPESVSLENLWKIYSLQTGIDASGQQRPSDTFQQIKKAQESPLPLSPLPSTDKNRLKTKEQIIMDEMVADYKRSNPF